MPYRPIVATLGFVLHPDRERVLMVHRTDKPGDEQHGKYNGLGGKMERDEDIASAMRREIREESGLECRTMTLRGTINWTGFGPSGADWLGFVFRIDAFDGTPFERSDEGPLSWVPLDRLDRLPMWEGDRHFLAMVFDDDPRAFHGFMPYSDGRPVGWSFVRLP